MALKDIAKQSIKQAVKRMTTSEMAQDLARMKAVQELKVKPPSDNVANVRDANFSYPKTIGNQTVNIKDLTGGVRMSDPKEVQRVKALADKIASPEGYISRIIVDHNNNVVEGQHRLEALRQLGVKDVPVFKIEDLADTMPVSKMEEAMREVGGIHSDHVNQLMQHALDDISEGGIEGARQLDYGKFQKHYDAALDAADVNRVLPASEREANLAKMLEPSKVPQTLYHGTGSDISEFRPNTFFSDDPKIAGMYAKSTDRAVEGSGPNIMPVNVQLKNPYVFDEYEARKKELSLGKTIAPDVPISQRMDETYNRLKAKGHDGVILKNFDDIGGRQTQYIVFEPKTIKSAIGNRGTYDVTDPDISKAEGGAVHLAGGGLKGLIKEPLKQAVKRVATSVLPAAEREANLQKFLEPSKTPMRLYHGTTATEGGKGEEAIRRIKPSKEGALGSGVYLTPKPNYADQYTYEGAGNYEGGNILPVHAQIKNPLVIDGSASNDPMIEALVRLGMDENKAINMVDRAYDQKGYIGKEVQSRAQAQGYDGLMKYDRDGDLSEVVAYQPSAVKSAIGNNGNYDTMQYDLNKAMGGAVHLAGGGLKGYIKEPLKQAAKRVIPKTSFEIAHDLARMRASLPVEKGGLGLPINNTSEDRARAMGFDVNAYHATDADITKFDNAKLGSNTSYNTGNDTEAVKSAMRGHWFSDRDLTNKDPRGYMFGDVVYPVKLANHKKINDKEFGSESYIVKDPDQIRSTNAAFDPFRRDAATAAAMGVAAPDLLAKEPEKKADGGVLHLAGKGLKQLVTEPLKQTVKRFIDPKEISSLANEYTQHKANIAFNREKVINQKPVRISEVLAPHEGKYMSTAGQADRLAPEYGGGAGFIGKQLYDPQYKGHGWMVTNQTTGNGMLNPKNYGGELPDIFIPQVGGEKMLYGNPLYFNDVLNTFRHKVAQGDVPSEQIEKINQALRNLKTKNIKTNEMEPVFDPSINILDPYLGDIARTFGKRTKISEILGGKGAGGEKNFDLVNHPALLEKYTDPTLKDVPTGYFGNYMFYPTGTGGTKSGLNTNYLYSIHGEAEPQVFNPAPANLLFPKWEESVEMQKGRPVTSADYRAGSNVYGRPTEQITEENLTNLQKKGFKSGGQVSDDAIKVEMWDKALHKAKGGPILGEIDDRTPEEIENASHAAFKLPKARPRMMAEPFQKPKEESTYQTATAYDPTIRQRLAGVVEKGLKAVSPKPRARALTENLTGTNEQGFGAADLVPYLGSTMQAQETGRDIKKSVNEGDYVGAAIDAIVGGGFAIPGAISTAKALKPTLKSLGPKAGQMAENYLIKSGMMPHVVKREGGNWIEETENKVLNLKSRRNGSDPAELLAQMKEKYTPEAMDQVEKTIPGFKARTLDQIQELENQVAINKFVEKNMMNYVKKQMATPSDPVRLGIEARVNKAQDILNQKLQNNLQARQQKILEAKAANADPAEIANLERDVSRYEQQIRQEYQDAVQSAGYVPPQELSRFKQLHNEMSRSEAGYPKEGMATTEPSKQWESLTDYNVQSAPVREVALEKYEDYPWLNKLNPEDKVHYLRGSPRESLGFSHMLDVLKEKLASGEIKPESLNNMSMDNLVHLTGKYDQELASKMNAERASARAGLPVHKEYPEGYKWIELNKPGTFAAESQAMGHSVRGYEPPEGHPDWIEGSDVHGNLDYGHGGWEGIKSGRAKVYSLVDSKGAPHATIEVRNQKKILNPRQIPDDVMEQLKEEGKRIGNQKSDAAGYSLYGDERFLEQRNAIDRLKFDWVDSNPVNENLITQIKGKLNAAPIKEYQPYVQDFVKSGNWSDVGDFNNTGLYHVDKPEAIQKYGSPYLNQQEFDEFSPSLYKAPEKKEGGEIERPPIYHAESGVAPFGIRHSGEGVKGRGWFGVLPNQEGGISTEISAESNGHEYPLITPSLTKEQLNLLLSGEKPTPEIYKAAEDWANLRRGKGQSPFASPSDLRFALPKKMGGQINHDAMLVELLNKGKRYG